MPVVLEDEVQFIKASQASIVADAIGRYASFSCMANHSLDERDFERIYDSRYCIFSWDKDAINAKLANVNKAAGFLAGRLSAIGFNAQMSAAVETLTHDILASSGIEGVVLNSDQVRSSVARRMGVHIVGDVEPSHYIEGIVEMMMDAARKHPFDASITIFWSAARREDATSHFG